jgi:toxin FitB
VEPFDVLAADQYAEVVTVREQASQPISVSDAQIAAICRVLKRQTRDRNTSHFSMSSTMKWSPAVAGSKMLQ